MEAWNRYAPQVYGMAARALGSEVEDFVQEVFFRVFSKAKTLQKPASLQSFIVSFAIRILKWELRRKKARAWLSFQQPETCADLLSQTMDIESRELLRKFYAMLERLAPCEHIVFALRHLESMTVEEIAQAMALSVSTVKRSLERGTRQMSRRTVAALEMAGLLEGKGCWR